MDNTSGADITLTTNNAQKWNSDVTFIGTNSLNMGTGAVTLGANRTLTVAPSQFDTGILTIGGSIGDNGNGYGLAKFGWGTLILTGSSTYTGMTTVESGTLQIGDGVTVGTSIASSSGMNAPNGHITINLPSGTPLTVNGPITASHLIFQNNSVAGSVSITVEDIEFHGSSSAGSSRITLSGESPWARFNDFSTAGNSQIVGLSLNSGGIGFTDSSTAGDAKFTNATVHFSQTSNAANAQFTNCDLEFYNLSDAGNAEIVVTNNCLVRFYDTSSAGNASITLSGSSNKVRFNNNASGGTAHIDLNSVDSVLDISTLSSAGTTLGSLEGNGTAYLGSKTLTIGGNNASVTFSGVIADGGLNGGTGGSIVKTGTGAWVLTGSSSYTGSTTIQSGALIINGSVTSGVTVLNGGLLGGSGTIFGNVINQGIVSPGNSPGRLTIGGNYTQTATGTLLIQIASATNYDQLIVGGTATLGGTLQVSLLNGYTPKKGDTFLYLTAGHIAGTFSNISTGTLIGLQPTYLSTGATLGMAPQAVILTAIQLPFAGVEGLTPNQRAVAKGLDKAVNHSRVSSLVEYLDGIALAGIPQKLEQIVPTALIPMFDASIATAQTQAFNLERRMEEIRGGATGFSSNGLNLSDSHGTRSCNGTPDSKQLIGKDGKALESVPISDRWGFFINGSGEFVDEEGTAIARGTNFTTGGITTGADYRLGDHAAVGLTAGYANTSANGRGDGPVKIGSGKLGLYGTVFDRGFFLNGAVGGGLSSYDTQRNTLGGVARGDANGKDFNALLGTGYTYRKGGLSAGPIASLRYSWVGIDSFIERGSLAPLRILEQSESSLKSTAGLQAAYAFHLGKITLTPQLRAQWQHEYLDTARGIGASFLSGGAFTVYGPQVGRDSLLLDIGTSVQLTQTVGVYAFYTGNLGGKNYTSHAINGGVQMSF